MRGPVQPPGMVGQAEQANLSVSAAERLQAVEDRLAVMQHAGCGIQDERAIRDDPRIMPAFPAW